MLVNVAQVHDQAPASALSRRVCLGDHEGPTYVIGRCGWLQGTRGAVPLGLRSPPLLRVRVEARDAVVERPRRALLPLHPDALLNPVQHLGRRSDRLPLSPPRSNLLPEAGGCGGGDYVDPEGPRLGRGAPVGAGTLGADWATVEPGAADLDAPPTEAKEPRPREPPEEEPPLKKAAKFS